MYKFFYLVLFFFSQFSYAQLVTYYVADWGSDRDSGTYSRPFQTIRKAVLTYNNNSSATACSIKVDNGYYVEEAIRLQKTIHI